ncbi:FAD-dependent monooxygenase [Rheinheimera baltica]|uniref:FAD-dependent monooxygenase n=1 Tax=Rheinheimera baltica TaxID=67576 RepID=UPI00273D0D7F|nr:FAD-dependent monooxygenase [Rheinheimera baltica]MDP5149726.1 FAD-dependent monooxygenase [Rheinheimera baltica]
MENIDITIVGAGSAGLTLALLLAPLGLSIVVLEQGDAPKSTLTNPQRVSALNLASQRVLNHVGAWQAIAANARSYNAMQVWDADSFARIEFNAQTERLEQLGWICDNEQIRLALYQQLQPFNNVRCEFNCTINSLVQSERDVLVNINQQHLLLSRLLVGADGVNSMVRRTMQLPLTHWDYQQQAIVGTIICDEPHNNIARQVFLPDGPLALLPLPQPNKCSIVWSCAPERAAALLAMDDLSFSQALTAASNSVLGPINIQTPRQSFNLTMRYSSSWQRGRVVLVADAAHSIHPLAGQGMNLGLMDVAALAELISEALADNNDFSESRLLRRYERWRKAEAQTLIGAMEVFKRGFSNTQPLLKLVRAVSMSGVDKLPWLKSKIIAAALGNSGDLPKLAQPQVKTAHSA